MNFGKLFCVLLVVGFVVLLVAFIARNGRETRLRTIEEARNLASVVSRHESSPVVQGISKAMGTNIRDYLQNRVADQERMASKSGDLVSLTIWAPGLHSMSAKMNFFAPSRTNSAHFVGWKFWGDDLMTGYVRPEEVGIWQAELCTITNSVMWSEKPNEARHGMSGNNANLKLERRDVSLIGALGRSRTMRVHRAKLRSSKRARHISLASAALSWYAVALSGLRNGEPAHAA